MSSEFFFVSNISGLRQKTSKHRCFSNFGCQCSIGWGRRCHVMPTAKFGSSAIAPRPSSNEEKEAGRALCQDLSYSLISDAEPDQHDLAFSAAKTSSNQSYTVDWVKSECCNIEVDNCCGHQQHRVCHPYCRVLHIYQLLLQRHFAVPWQT